MKKYIFIFFITARVISVNAQEDYQFINEVITPYLDDNPIPLDSLFLKDQFIKLSDHIELDNLNKITVNFWWKNSSCQPPVELFLKNFNFEHLKTSIVNADKTSKINFKELKPYFKPSNEVFIKKNPKNRYLSISKPIFNSNKDWCFILESNYIPYTNTGGNGMMHIYIKIDNKWILYNSVSLWLS